MGGSVETEVQVTRHSKEAQTFAVKRAEVEFHNFASLGEPERAIAAYAEENLRRAGLIRKHLEFIGPLSPFLEICANAGHTSYMLANDFGADGFALDISADALRHGIALMDRWGLTRAPVRIAGDAVNLPFRDRSLRLVMLFQSASQFMNLENLFAEINRVLAPGGTLLFAEEPVRRLLSLRLYRTPYYGLMRPWERKLHDWGLLGYIARDVVGADQEESFGIRQNHALYLSDWRRLIARHFVDQRYELFVPEHGWGESVVKNLAVRLDPLGSVWRAARLLGGTLAAVCRKAGTAPELMPTANFETLLRCPDCHQGLTRNASEALYCAACGFAAADESGVYNLLPSAERAELYPGDRGDIIDFCLPNHERKLLDGWHELEGVFGAKYRWMGPTASANLMPFRPGPRRLRIRGHIHENSFAQGKPVKMSVSANGAEVGRAVFERAGTFIFEVDLPAADEYKVEIAASPAWEAPPDRRLCSISVGMIRLASAEQPKTRNS
jgi:ubiquinone/menaquinone biosynthesis C-methylase UbiE